MKPNILRDAQRCLERMQQRNVEPPGEYWSIGLNLPVAYRTRINADTAPELERILMQARADIDALLGGDDGQN